MSSRFSLRSALIALAAAALAVALTPSTALARKAAKSVPTGDPSPQPFKQMGEIVDCGDYLVMGKRGIDDRRFVQAKNIESGMPACFVTNDDVYLLVSLGALAKAQFQPTENFLGGGTILEGTVYQKGSFKALTITNIERTTRFTDRQTRREDNPEPTRKLDNPRKKN